MDKDLIVNEEYLYKGQGFSNKLPTGIITLDIALGGGLPLNGAIVEVYGEESHGKSTMSYRMCKKCTDNPVGYVTLIDSEDSYDSEWARVQGVDPSKVISYRPPFMEAAINLIIDDITAYKNKYHPWKNNPSWKPNAELCSLAGSKDIETVKTWMDENAPPHIILWDSLAASPVKSIAEQGAEFKEGMAFRARLIKMFLSRYQVAVVGCTKLCMILINQVIDDIGSYNGGVTTPGGRGLRHGKHLSIYMKKSGGDKDSDSFKVTDYTVISLTKNKITPVIASFPVIFSKSRGFLGATSIYEYLASMKWFKLAGSWKKFEFYRIDKETGEIVDREEISFQTSAFYTLLEARPEVLNFLCEVILSQFIAKFPFSTSLKSVNLKSVIDACIAERTFIPDSQELQSLTGEVPPGLLNLDEVSPQDEEGE